MFGFPPLNPQRLSVAKRQNITAMMDSNAAEDEDPNENAAGAPPPVAHTSDDESRTLQDNDPLIQRGIGPILPSNQGPSRRDSISSISSPSLPTLQQVLDGSAYYTHPDFMKGVLHNDTIDGGWEVPPALQ